MIPLAFDRAAVDTFVVPKAVIAQSTGALLFGVLAALLVVEGPRAFPWRPMHLLVGAFVATYALASVFAVDQSVALVGAHDRALGVLTIASFVPMYFAAAALIQSRQDLLAVLGGVVVSSGLVLAYSMLQWIGRDPFAWAISGSLRTFGTIGNPTTLGHYLSTMAMTLFAAAVFSTWSKRVRLTLATYSFLLLLGAVTTGTRAIILGILSGGVVLMFLAWIAEPSWRRRAVQAVGATIGAVALVGLLAFSPVGERLSVVTSSDSGPTVNLVNDSMSSRLLLYEVAAAEVADRPVLGVGPDNYAVMFPSYRPERASAVLQTTTPETSPHSWVAKVTTDAGVAGLSIYVAIIAAAILAAFRRRQTTTAIGVVMLVAYLGTGVITVNDLSTEWIPWLALGLVVSGHAGSLRSPALPVRQPLPPWRRGVAAFLILLTIVLATYSAFPWEASRAAEAARKARARGDYATATTESNRALAIDGRRAAYWHGLALAQVATGAPTKAVESFSAAVDREPYNATYLSSLARGQLLLGQNGIPGMKEQSLDTARRAVRADPNNPEPHFGLAVVLYVLGRPADAVAAAERGQELIPPRLPDESVPNATSRAYLALGQLPRAEFWARVGIAQFARSVELRVTLAQVLLSANNPTDALKAVEEALAIQPNHAAAQSLKQEIARRLSRP